MKLTKMSDYIFCSFAFLNGAYVYDNHNRNVNNTKKFINNEAIAYFTDFSVFYFFTNTFHRH